MSRSSTPPLGIADVAHAVHERRRARKRRAAGETICSAGALAAALLWFVRDRSPLPMLYAPYLLLNTMLAARRRGANERDDALVSAALASAASPGDVPALLDALSFLLPAGRAQAWARITDLLPQVTLSNASALTPAHFRTLAERLTPAGQPAFRPDAEYRRTLLAILDLLARTNHTPALPQVEGLWRVCNNEEVREAARRCRARLLQVDFAASSSGTLLRPADGPPAEASHLLRPSEPAPDDLLLRPAVGDPE